MGASLCADCGDATEDLFTCGLCGKRICVGCIRGTGLACPGAITMALCRECDQHMKRRIEEKRNKPMTGG